MIDHGERLSDEEVSALNRAGRSGAVAAQLYRDGVFSEPDFVLLGVLQRLAIRGRLAFRGLSGGGACIYTYAPVRERAFMTQDFAQDAA